MSRTHYPTATHSISRSPATRTRGSRCLVGPLKTVTGTTSVGSGGRPRMMSEAFSAIMMQTIPTFVYLVPTLVLFGLGIVPGLIATVIFAIPAPIRLTYLGISQVQKPLIEAGEAFGCTRWQLLVKVKLPAALPTIMPGLLRRGRFSRLDLRMR